MFRLAALIVLVGCSSSVEPNYTKDLVIKTILSCSKNSDCIKSYSGCGTTISINKSSIKEYEKILMKEGEVLFCDTFSDLPRVSNEKEKEVYCFRGRCNVK